MEKLYELLKGKFIIDVVKIEIVEDGANVVETGAAYDLYQSMEEMAKKLTNGEYLAITELNGETKQSVYMYEKMFREINELYDFIFQNWYVSGTWYDARGGMNSWDYLDEVFDNYVDAKTYYNEALKEVDNGFWKIHIDDTIYEINMSLSNNDEVIRNQTIKIKKD